jgi:4-hydroxy-tetrahydrodipicolinate reductase
MGLRVTQMLYERGVSVVAAIAREGSKTVGKDIGELAKLGRKLNVKVRSDAAQALSEAKPDIVVVTVKSYVEPQLEIFKTAVLAGANVVTLAEEMLYPFATAKSMSVELDKLAKSKNVTITGTGHQDGYWVSLVSVLMGTGHNVTKVDGKLSWNVDDFGRELAKQQQVGASVEVFKKWLKEAKRPPTFGKVSLYALAANARLTPLDARTRTEPVIALADVKSKALGETVKAGHLLGYTDVDTLTTKEGITLSISSSGKVYVQGDADYNEWKAKGSSPLHLHNVGFHTQDTTCATLVNRIPDVIAATPGIVTIDQLPQLHYQQLTPQITQ